MADKPKRVLILKPPPPGAGALEREKFAKRVREALQAAKTTDRPPTH